MSRTFRLVSVGGALVAAALLTSSAMAQKAPPGGGKAAGAEAGPKLENGEEINIAVGETKTISARDVRNYSEGVAGVIDIKLTGDNQSFILNGRRPGSTTLLLIKNDATQVTLNINVFLRSPQAVEKELNQLLEGVGGVRIKRIGAHIVVDGTVAGEAELKRVQQVAALYPGQVESLVGVAGAAGTPMSVLDDKKYIVRMDVYFVQYDKNSSYGVGVGWPSTIGGDGVVQSEFNYDLLAGTSRTATVGLTNQPIPKLDIASRKGWAKVLKQATVITNNGVEANFHSGGEQLFTVNTGLTVGLQRVEFGADVTVLPRFNPKTKDLDVKLVTDISDLTAPIAGGSLPGRNTSKLTTNVSLKLGQSLVLSGIRTKSQTRNVTGLPILSDIPILGFLFGSTSNNELETEGAIFIVPSVVETVPAQAQEMVDTALAKFRDYHGKIDEVNAYDKSPGGTLKVPRNP